MAKKVVPLDPTPEALALVTKVVATDLKPAADTPGDLRVDTSASEIASDTRSADLPSSGLPESFIPKTCINCGAAAGGLIEVVKPGVYHCASCDHTWTLAEEQAPFRHIHHN